MILKLIIGKDIINSIENIITQILKGYHHIY